jgi:hypothetical protein
MMQTCNEIYLGHGDSSSKALYSLSRTVSHVKNKLESPGALSDSTITLVLSLISQEQLKKFDSRAKIHLDGLRRMIELRGGLEQLEGKPPLLLKVCKYVQWPIHSRAALLIITFCADSGLEFSKGRCCLCTPVWGADDIL